MALINYEELEKPIQEIEKVLKMYDSEEQALVLKILNQRYGKKVQDQRIRDNMANMDIGTLKNLTKKMFKRGEE